MVLYDESARYYDLIYERLVDQTAGATALRTHIARRNPAARSLLEAACGTGLILERMATDYRVEGFDRSPRMVERARRRLPGVPLTVADMTTFASDERYDAVICVGSSIGYARTDALLRQTIRVFADHLAPGGIVLVEPWFPPEVWEDGRQGLDIVDEPGLKLARLATSARDGDASVLDFDFLIGASGRVERFSERHVMGLFTEGQMRAAFTAAGLAVERDSGYPTGRGLYIGQRPGGEPVTPGAEGSGPNGAAPPAR